MQVLGRVMQYRFNGGDLQLQVEGARLLFSPLTPDLIRIQLLPDGMQPLESVAVVKTDWAPVALQFSEEPGVLRLSTAQLSVEISTDSARLTFRDRDGRVIAADQAGGIRWAPNRVAWAQAAPPDAHYYGFGQKLGHLEKRGRSMSLWTTDEPLHILEHDQLYQAIPFHLVLSGGRCHGLFLDATAKVTYDVAKAQADTFNVTAEQGWLDAYLFAGPDPKQVVSRYTELTGRMELPPRWALGYQQCRYSYYPEARVREVARELREREIPCDVIYLDIDYMDGYRVFTWDPVRFPDPAGLVADLAADGFKVVTIVDPGVKVDGRYATFREGVAQGHFVCHEDGELFIGTVWPGRTAFPDFNREGARRWWGDAHRPFINEVGIAGIWNDMNEPSCFARNTFAESVVQGEDGAQVPHALVHNTYGHLMAKATYEGLRRLQPTKRPFVLTRSGYAGIQRYAAVWMGDNHSWWEHLFEAMPVCMGMGLSGVPFVGADIGGFQRDCSGELLARWTQMGALTPFCRNHSACDTIDQEPWAFGERIEAICREYLQLRYRLMPFLYNEFYRATQTGLPVMRPLLLEYPTDPNTHNLSDQYLLGQDLLVCPVYQPGAAHRMVYIPEGTWVDFWTGQAVHGPQHLVAEAPLERMPMYVRAGAILPMAPLVSHTAAQAPPELTLALYAGADGALELYEDEGEGYGYTEGRASLTQIRMNAGEGRLLLTAGDPVGGYRPDRERVVVRLIGFRPVCSATADGRPMDCITVNGAQVMEIPTPGAAGFTLAVTF